MILTQEVEIKIAKNNIKHYCENFNCKLGDILKIHPNDLIKYSYQILDVECDVCHKKLQLSFFHYTKNFMNYNFYSCKSCSKIKRNKTCLEKYGNEHPISLDEFKSKREDNNLNKYGVKNTLELDSIRINIKKTCLEKYGVDNPRKNKEISDRIKKTNNERYNADSPLESEIIKNKIEQTNIKKYGFKCVLKNENIQTEIKKTCIEKYGVNNPWLNKDIRNKIKNTLFKNYGVYHPSQSQYLYDLMIKKSFIIKKYKDTDLHYQGTYEFDFLNKYQTKINIKNGFTIKYECDNKKRVYYPDFYLPDFNLIVEIKSTKWYEENLNINLAKKEQCLNNNYNFIFIIDKNYEQFDKIINLISEK